MASKLKMTSLVLIPVFITALIIVLIMIFSSGSYVQTDLPQIKERGTLKVVTDYNSVGYFVSGDTVAGFNSELLKTIEKYAGLKIEVDVQNNLANNIQDLKNGKYDLIARNIPVNANLKNQLAFTLPIIHNKLVLIQRIPENEEDKNLIRSHLDLAKTTIHIAKSSPAMFRLENLAREIGDTIIIQQDSLYETPQLIMKVASGEIDYTVSDANTAKTMAEILPTIDIKTDIGFTHLESWAVRKTSHELLDSLNTWIRRFQETKDFMRIYQKYYEKK